jgi:RHS repeat-associated protein
MNPASACVTAGANSCLSRFSIGRRYGPDGAIAQLTFNGKPLINAAQDVLGRPAVRWTSTGITTGYRYDSEDLRLNQMSTLTAAATKDGKNVPVQVNGYQYDGGGNIQGYANASVKDGKNDYVSRFGFGYDAANRVVDVRASVQNGKEDLNSDGNYTYDSGHRFRTRNLNIAANGSNLNRSWTYQYGAEPTEGPLHAPQSIEFTLGETKRTSTFGYDDLGRMARIGISQKDKLNGQERHIPLLSNRAMTWDGEGRLLRVRGVKDAAINANETLLWEDYLYDYDGNRTVKIYPWSPEKDHGQKDDRETAILYMTPFYARPYDQRGTVQLSQGTLPAVTLAAPVDPSEDPVVTYLYSDLPVGSMTAAVTVFGEATYNNATVIARREYSPFGLELTSEELATTGRVGVGPMSVFHGKELDRVTNFSSFGARYYSRDLGMWLLPDPQLRGKTNPANLPNKEFSAYALSADNPVQLLDPDGRRAFLASGAPDESVYRRIEYMAPYILDAARRHENVGAINIAAIVYQEKYWGIGADIKDLVAAVFLSFGKDPATASFGPGEIQLGLAAELSGLDLKDPQQSAELWRRVNYVPTAMDLVAKNIERNQSKLMQSFTPQGAGTAHNRGWEGFRRNDGAPTRYSRRITPDVVKNLDLILNYSQHHQNSNGAGDQ